MGVTASLNPTAPAATVDADVPTDEQLLELLRDGSASAGEILVKRHCQPLLRYLHRLVGSDHLAEELHQQAWVSVMDHLDRFDKSSASGGFKAWLFRIATNKANDHWRSAGREKVAKQAVRLTLAGEHAPDAGHRMEVEEREARVRDAIARLPENQRQVLMLRYYGNLKFVEIAEMVGCPLNTALGRMHKAMLKLKQIMEQ